MPLTPSCVWVFVVAGWDDPSGPIPSFLLLSDDALLAQLRSATLDAEVEWAALVAETLLWARGNTTVGAMPDRRRLEVYASNAGPAISAPVFGARFHTPGSAAAAVEQAWANRLQVPIHGEFHEDIITSGVCLSAQRCPPLHPLM